MLDKNMEIFLDAVRNVKDTVPNGFAAIKITGLCNPKLLERLSQLKLQTAEFFLRVSAAGHAEGGSPETGRCQYYSIDRSTEIDFETFAKGWRHFFHVESEDKLR